MSKLEELIQQLCPDGVEYKPLGEVCKLSRGRVYSKDYLRDNPGEYPVYSSQTANDGELGKINTYDCEGDYLTWTTDGAYAGTIFHRSGKFSITNVCGLIKVENSLLTIRFLYYWLSITAKGYVYQGMGNPKLMTNQIEVIPIPLPPLPIQEEIVRILDKFTQVTAELKAELKARKDEYDYYRNILLNSTMNKISLKEIAINSCSGATPLKSKTEYYINGNIPWLRTQEVVYKDIYKTECYLTEAALKNTAVRWIPANCIIVAISGASAGRCAINKIPLTTNQHCLCIEIDENKAIYQYVFYCICNQYDELIAKKEGVRGDLNSTKILSLKIPLHPLAEQQRIVDILDRFEKLTNDMTEGIPAEIEATQQMYEYYRDKLLTFKRKE